MSVINRFHCKALLVFIVSLFFLTNNSANAACRLLHDQEAEIHFTTLSNLVIPRDAAKGTVLYTSSSVVINPAAGGSCDSPDDTQALVNVAGTDIQNNISSFEWNDSVGYRIMFESTKHSGQLSSTRTVSGLSMGDISLDGYSYRLQILYMGGGNKNKTGRYFGGGLIANYYYGATKAIKFFIDNQASISEGTCAVYDVSVKMGSQTASAFNRRYYSLPPVPFTITLSCSPGLNSIKYRLDPAPGIGILDQSASLIALDSSSSASGIGVQILDNSGKPLPLGIDILLPNHTAAAPENFFIQLKAAYYKVANSVKGGTANTLLTYTMNYQ